MLPTKYRITKNFNHYNTLCSYQMNRVVKSPDTHASVPVINHPLDSLGRSIIGAHTSSASHPSNALKQGAEINATGVQFFTANQRQWTSKSYDPEICSDFIKTAKQTKIGVNMSHGSYLINLGSNKEEILTKSRKAFIEEIKRCQSLNLSFMVFHPGSATGSPRQECLDRIVESLIMSKEQIEAGPTQILIESTAGQGSNVGDRFEDLQYLLKKSAIKNMGICLDTCHMFAAGYDLRDRTKFEKTLDEFEKIVGIEKLKAFHVNDSATPFGSKVDRHAQLGEGFMGWETFSLLMTHPATKCVPKYLETPGNLSTWKVEIERLRKLESGVTLQELGLNVTPVLSSLEDAKDHTEKPKLTNRKSKNATLDGYLNSKKIKIEKK